MASIVSGLDSHTPLRVGENLHAERDYSNELSEKVVQFFFQLVRSEDHSKLEAIQRDILLSIKGDLEKNYDTLDMMYKLIGQTRDIISGKGEQKLAFMQIWGFYDTGYEALTYSAIKHFVQRVNDEHPYGSWKDVKYFCQYILERTHDENHPLISFTEALILEQVNRDYQLVKEAQRNGSGAGESAQPSVTLAGRWCPRGGSKHNWLHNRIAMKMFPQFMATAKTKDSKSRARKKCRAKLSEKITFLNRYLNTTQVNQCKKDWGNINFNTVTSATMRKQSRAFANTTKTGEERSSSEDRRNCAANLKQHFEDCKKDPNTAKVHGRRLNVYELAKDAAGVQRGTTEEDRINLQWEDNKKNNAGLTNFIPCSDVSYSMHADKMVPYYSSIGLGIRASEMTHPAFRDRVLSFADFPVWHNLSDCLNFADKVRKIADTDSGLGTNFYRALKMILDVILEHEIPPKEVETMVLGIFSDMQINAAVQHCNTFASDMAKNVSGNSASDNVGPLDIMYEVMEKMFAEAGLKSKYNAPYKVPHILFWNLRQTEGFPVSATEKNVTMLAGYNSVLLNALCDKGIDALKEFTPRRMLRDILNHLRYKVMAEDVRQFVIASKLE